MGLHKADLGKYLQVIQSAQRDEEEAADQPNLINEASFCWWMHLIPRPPSLVGRQTTSQRIWFLLDWICSPDQRKFLMKRSMCPDTDLGRGKTLAIWVAKLPNTCLTRILRPAKDSSLDFHAESLKRKLLAKEVAWPHRKTSKVLIWIFGTISPQPNHILSSFCNLKNVHLYFNHIKSYKINFKSEEKKKSISLTGQIEKHPCCLCENYCHVILSMRYFHLN